jgi:hypothetical protein
MKNLILGALLFCAASGYSQKTPVLHIGKDKLELSSLDINVNILGNIATTTYDMSFYNASSRVLEGSLKFPLGENQEISRLALEMNGKLREAVIVEKELGRVAFEGIVRRGVDPALLEKGKGNTYNVRVYPIPANGYKRVVLAYEQELVLKENAHYYYLPLNFINTIANFKVTIASVNQKKQPIIVEGEETMSFSSWQNSFKSSFKKEHYIPNKSILVKIPLALKEEKLTTSSNYFYFYKTLQPQLKKRKKPAVISLLWDVSLSMEDRDLDKELALLDLYFNHLQNVDVEFIAFSNTVTNQEKYSIKNGNWATLKYRLRQTIYDGGTSYKVIDDLRLEADAILVSSDGLSTLSAPLFNKKTPVFLINSNTEVAFNELNGIAKQSAGGCINLNTSSIKEGFSILTTLPFQYLGFRSNTQNIEVYPRRSSNGLLDFSVAGRNYQNGEKITFLFGFGNELTQEVSVILKTLKSANNDIIKRIWAKHKLAFLRDKKKENKAKIIELATNYGLITDFTSLIVLENIEDYVTYNILPPEELLEEYNRIKNNRKQFANRSVVSSNNNLPPPPTPERIEVIEDEKEVEETFIESTETDETEVVMLDEMVEVEIAEEISEDVSFMIIEEAPIYPGCSGTKSEKKACFSQELKKYIQQNFNFELANELGLSAGRKRIFISFKINENGFIAEVNARAPHIKLKNEAIRVLTLLPQMIPGKQRGRSVAVRYSLPLTISINELGEIDTRQVVFDDITNVTTKTQPSYKKYQGSLAVSDRMPETAYLTSLAFFKDKKTAYAFYLIQRESYKEIPHFYMDVADYFYEQLNAKVYAKRILSNVAELDADSYEVLRAFAYKLEERKEYDLALFIYQQILELRPEDAQSYRDLALAYENVGLCQKAFDLFLDIVSNKIYENKQHRRVFKGLQDVADQEIRQLIDTYKEDLDPDKIPEKYLVGFKPLDLRVVVDWNHNDTDIDLHVIDPNLEECYYSHPKTQQGGELSKDMTQGFGPEQFSLKKAKKGFYYIKINYFGDGKQKIETPTFMKVTIYKNQGKRNQEKIISVIRLTKQDKEVVIAKIEL